MAVGIRRLLEGSPLESSFSVEPIDPDRFVLFYAVVTAVVCAAIVAKDLSKAAVGRKRA